MTKYKYKEIETEGSLQDDKDDNEIKDNNEIIDNQVKK